MKIYLDGKLVEKDEAKISVFDHGLLYGDGVFEGIRAYNGRVFRLREHLDRIYNSARAIMLDISMSKKEMEAAVIETLAANKLRDAYIRLVVTRGIGDLGLDPKNCSNPTVFIITDKIKLYPEELYTRGLEVVTSSIKRNIPQALSPCIKSLNYLNNILAKVEASRAGVPEAIMLNAQGYVAECTGDNIFLLKENTLITPPSSAGALEGITRGAVMELAKNKLKLLVKEDVFTTYHLYTADECFLTGTAAEVIPMVKIDGRPVGDGKPGKTTLRLVKEFRELTRLTGVPIYEK
ncbi:MAG: branched-chain-amino-acid transaminase [Endomicrobiales bacterium]